MYELLPPTVSLTNATDWSIGSSAYIANHSVGRIFKNKYEPPGSIPLVYLTYSPSGVMIPFGGGWLCSLHTAYTYPWGSTLS